MTILTRVIPVTLTGCLLGCASGPPQRNPSIAPASNNVDALLVRDGELWAFDFRRSMILKISDDVVTNQEQLVIPPSYDMAITSESGARLPRAFRFYPTKECDWLVWSGGPLLRRAKKAGSDWQDVSPPYHESAHYTLATDDGILVFNLDGRKVTSYRSDGTQTDALSDVSASGFANDQKLLVGRSDGSIKELRPGSTAVNVAKMPGAERFFPVLLVEGVWLGTVRQQTRLQAASYRIDDGNYEVDRTHTNAAFVGAGTRSILLYDRASKRLLEWDGHKVAPGDGTMPSVVRGAASWNGEGWDLVDSIGGVYQVSNQDGQLKVTRGVALSAATGLTFNGLVRRAQWADRRLWYADDDGHVQWYDFAHKSSGKIVMP